MGVGMSRMVEIYSMMIWMRNLAASSKSAKSQSKKRKAVSENAGKGNIQFMLSNMSSKKTEERNIEDDDILSELIQEIGDTQPSSEGQSIKSAKTGKNLFDAEKEAARNYMKTFSMPKPRIKMTSIKINKPVENAKEVVKNVAEIEEETINESGTKEIFKSENILKSINNDKITEKKKQIFETESIIKADNLKENDSIAAEISNCTESMLLDDDFDMTNIEDFELNPTENKENICEEITEEQLLNGWNTLLEGSNNEDIATNIKIDSSDLPLTLNSDGNKTFRFFWWDAFQDRKTQPGVVFFFASSDPSKLVTLLDVYHEFNKNVSNNLKINNFKSKKTEKNYAFDPDIPTHSEYLEVRYSAKSPIIPQEFQSGDTYSTIFGLNTSYLEIVLIEQKIRGPCWLEVVDPEPLHIVDSTKALPPPPLVVLSVNLRTIVGHGKYGVKNEIVMLSGLVQNKYCIDKQTSKPRSTTFLCSSLSGQHGTPVRHTRRPQVVQRHQSSTHEQRESPPQLLHHAILEHRSRPDRRPRHAGLPTRPDLFASAPPQRQLLRQTEPTETLEFPPKGRFERELFCGRLVCDIKVSAKELIRSRSFDLDALCRKVLKLKEGQRVDLEAEDVPRMFGTSRDIIKLITITMQDAAFILQMMYELNVIPLALQITNIAGNVMSRTLLGGRSERNEYLLLHAFSEKDYLVPDKVYDRNVNGGDDKVIKGKRKKATYSGGLVLDPKIGFYDKLILLMDFNSLYPSIIQEYNVCFTTIQHSPDRGCDFSRDKTKTSAILPAEIRKLVESRRNVKSLMKNVDVSSELYMQYNIRQMALKLTANSMYGCLGFANSRFFAKEIAAFVTQKGREILTNTKDAVEKMNFEVIYGDTDSIMINTNSLDYDDVFKIGGKIKQEINRLYRQVELDIDGVFKYLLLLKKKKYAAVSVTKSKSGELKFAQEHKGLDIVRRDWSQLSAECGKAVLNCILSSDNLEDKIENVREHLTRVKTDLNSNSVPLTLLTIAKQLTKNPKEYAAKNALPHVQVALRYNQKGGKQLQNGDTVHYIICDDGSAANVPATQRAYHIEELKTSGDVLKVDIKYYLSQQIYPVISRLCEPIPGLDGYQIATWLGVDAATASKKPKQVNDDEDIQYNDAIKYRKCDPFIFVCFACKSPNKVSEFAYNGYLFLNKCVNTRCSDRPIEHLGYVANQLTLSIRNYIKKFYKFEMTCEDPACLNDDSFVTINLAGKYSLCPTCKEGVVYLKYTAQDLHLQLTYFQALFQISKGSKKVQVDDNLKKGYETLRGTVGKILNRSGFNKINLGEMFAAFIPSKNHVREEEEEDLVVLEDADEGYPSDSNE
ncbi:dna polymerase alpha catalytic subunit [Holotrichia oblita]|uniref:Dna polymerase alpha catalytic subunit n=1 Tax=Holotrichia oblita TaxID=644536 RepID=A0ACB9TI11_HOLOL|nr:dna polymerase alpha catalytic subunit [Holotrichia oblita]